MSCAVCRRMVKSDSAVSCQKADGTLIKILDTKSFMDDKEVYAALLEQGTDCGFCEAKTKKKGHIKIKIQKREPKVKEPEAPIAPEPQTQTLPLPPPPPPPPPVINQNGTGRTSAVGWFVACFLGGMMLTFLLTGVIHL